MSEEEKEKREKYLLRKYETAIKTRNFEIELFWKRALFFWGFIAVAFAGYVGVITNINSKAPNIPEYISLLIACFGFICSVAWSLANRGSKYWQENWENIITELEEREEIGWLFGRIQPIRNSKKEEKEPKSNNCKWWFEKRPFSVSKLAIFISDILSIAWFLLIYREVIKIFDKVNIDISVITMFALALAALCLIRLMACCVKGKGNDEFKGDELCGGYKKKR